MKPTRHLLLLIVSGLFYMLPASSQKLIETLDAYNNSFVQEKMYVHFDKPVYNTGETIWFKAYLLNSNSSLSKSTNFYAELLNEEGKVIDRKVYPIFESSAAGNFDIPQHAKNSQLTFRAYTTWMLNFDTSFLYTKPINIAAPTSQPKSTQQNQTQLCFFPEGGNWVTGLPAVIAFKATDNNGLPKAVSGIIKNTAGKFIASFASVHDGMGKIIVEPLPIDTYYAEWKDENNVVQKTKLPVQEQIGVALQITPTGSHIGFTLTRTNGENLKKVQVIAQMFNQVAYKANVNFTENEISGAIPVKQLISGILQFTVFDADWKPLAERIVFINKNDFLFPSAVNLLDKNLSKRGKNTIEIEVPDTLKTNLSVAVTDGSLKGNNMEESIISRLLLTSDLKGYIHEPAYYFSSTADSVKEHLDLVMMTNGWRRYNWEQLAQGTLPTIMFPKNNYLSIEGSVFGITSSQTSDITQLNLLVQAKDSSRQLLMAPVDKNGSFALNGLVFFDTVKVFYQFNKEARLNRKATVNFNPNTYKKDVLLPRLPSEPFPASTYLSDRNQFFANKLKEVLPQYNKKVKTLEEVVVKAKTKTREEELEKRYTSGLFQTGNSRNFSVVDDPNAISSLNVLNYLQSRVAGLQIYSSEGTYTVTRRGDVPALFVDEMQADMDQLVTLPMSDVAYVKVIDPPFIGVAGNGVGGAIAVYTKKGGDAKATASKGLEQAVLAGYDRLKQFYSPNYATFTPLHEIEDVRSTLYWAPYILTDKTNKKIKIEFYNNDVSQSLRIVLEGLNENGQVTRVEKVIQ